MTQLAVLSSDQTSQAGGILARFPSGKTLTATWVQSFPINDSLAAAKTLSAKLLNQLLEEGCNDDADRTNWASFTAAVQRIVSDWSDKRRAEIRAKATPANEHGGTLS